MEINSIPRKVFEPTLNSKANRKSSENIFQIRLKNQKVRTK